jgi:hypothetical protein
MSRIANGKCHYDTSETSTKSIPERPTSFPPRSPMQISFIIRPIFNSLLTNQANRRRADGASAPPVRRPG